MRTAAICFLTGSFLFSCEEVERQTLIRTELDFKDESVISVSGSVADLPDGTSIIAYGHCWSDSGTPTVDDARTVFENEPSQAIRNFTTTVDDFLGYHTYYFRSYVTDVSGESYYGNVLSVTTGEVSGRWVKFGDFFSEHKVQREDHACGLYEVEFRNFGLFMSAAFYADKVIAGGGYALQGIKSIDFQHNSEVCVDVNYDEFKVIENNALDSRIPYLKMSAGASWELATKLDYDLFGFGAVAHVDGNLLYMGATNVPYHAGYGLSVYEMYLQSANGPGLDHSNAFKVYDIPNNQWLTLAPYPDNSNIFGASFLLDDKIVLVCGITPEFDLGKSVWVYSIPDNKWSEGSPFPGSGRMHPMAFVANGKAYVGGGFSAIEQEAHDGDTFINHPVDPQNDFYEYDPGTGQWTRVADFPGPPRGGAFAFGIGESGYVGSGATSVMGEYYKDFWRYDAIQDQWKRLEDFPGNPRFGASGFANQTTGAAGFGFVTKPGGTADGGLLPTTTESDIWFFDPAKNKR